MTFVERRNKLIAAVSAHLGVPVLLSDQVQPEAEPPYIVYSVTTDYISDRGIGDYTLRDGKEDNFVEVRAEQPSATFSFTACSVNRCEGDEYILGEDEAQALAERAQGFFIHSGQDSISAAGFVVADVSNAGSRSILVIDDMARRYGFDVRLRYYRTDERDISTIKEATPVGELKKE